MIENNNINLELKTIIECIKRYNIVHPEGMFVYHFVGWKKSEEICEECGDHCSCVDENRSMIGAYGDLETLRMMTNDLRNIIEDSQEEGFVNF